MKEQGRNYKYFKEDIKDLIEYFNEAEDVKKKEMLLDWIDSCVEYTVSVVEHVAYGKNFIGNSSESTRREMENLNRKRTQHHNEAIRLTMSLDRELKHSTGKAAYFLPLNHINLDGIHTVTQLTSRERNNLADLFFQTSSIIAGLTKEEVKEFGLEEIKNDVKRKTYRYGIDLGSPRKDGNVKTAEDAYDEIR